MSFDEQKIGEMVRRVVLRTLGMESLPSSTVATPSHERRPLLTEREVEATPEGGELRYPARALITPLAREVALRRQVTLIPEPAPVEASLTPASSSPGQRAVALGADHGGFAMKETLKGYIQKLGYAVIDCGTSGTESVDYPDFAYAVARLVSEGRAWRGIIVDGAGIGSCMAANKVPGVRAAMCYDLSTAANSREHNDANVLTLGGRLIGDNLAQAIVKTWL
ncbi:MAG: RpiB/LacA/LacB family sugar-phosphate isomerase, partial [Chloroflexota bacterium]|nr:RpiB/LacA/LacB family sugar-phosphate isomerase [Chloroflexota bacterium]